MRPFRLGVLSRHQALGLVYVIPKTVTVSQRRNDSLSLNCLKSSVSSLSRAVITRPSALSCSIRAFCLSEFALAFWKAVSAATRAGISVPLILLLRILDGLLREAVHQLEGGHGQAVDEEPKIERPLGLVPAVAKLPGDAEAVAGVLLPGLEVAWRGRPVEEIDVVWPVLDAVAQQVGGSALRALALQPSEELAPCRAVVEKVQRFGDVGLRGVEKAPQTGPGERSTRGHSARGRQEASRCRRRPAPRSPSPRAAARGCRSGPSWPGR